MNKIIIFVNTSILKSMQIQKKIKPIVFSLQAIFIFILITHFYPVKLIPSEIPLGLVIGFGKVKVVKLNLFHDPLQHKFSLT